MKNPTPYSSASFLSRWTFCWFNVLVRQGYKKPLVEADMYDLEEDNKSAEVFERFCKYWSYPESSNISLPLAKTFKVPLICSAILKLISTCLGFVGPKVLDYFLIWLASDEPDSKGYFYAAAMFAASLTESILSNQYEYKMACIGMQIKTAITSALHRKALLLSPSAKTKFSTGQMVNLLSVDTQQVTNFVASVNYFWIAPLQITVAIYLLWQQLGVASLAGVTVMVVFIPFNVTIATKFQGTMMKLMGQKDKRSKLMKEIVDGIKVLKMYAWETAYIHRVKEIRKQEVTELKIQTNYFSLATFIMSSTPIFVALSSFITFTLINENNVLDSSKAFVSLALFRILRDPLTKISALFTSLAMFKVARDRLDSFKGCEEMDTEAIGREETAGIAVKVQNGDFTWGNKDGGSTLQDVNLTIAKNKLVAVVGAVGSGKSSLLASFLGDMDKINGSVNIAGKVAYVSQQAWIQNATVRNNIIFTGTMNLEKYDAVLDSCALKSDLEILAAGDATEIGEKGINLSGGQKQRVSLARAVYADCDVYLLDDPLSAVDSHVGKHIFDKVIGPKGMLKGTTRILVTHKVSLLPHVDEIVVMKDGRISEHGSYRELIGRKEAFSEFLAEYLAEEQSDDDSLDEIRELVEPELERRLLKASETQLDGTESRHRSVSITSRRSRRTNHSSHHHIRSRVEQSPVTGQLVEDETAQSGSVKWTVYADYIRASGLSSCIIILAVNIVASGFSIASSVWLSAWSDDALHVDRATDSDLRKVRLVVYGSFGLCEAISLFFVSLITFLGTLKASAVIHDTMLVHILKAPMSFYDTTPLGRILNRFSKDVDNMDSMIRMNIFRFASGFFSTIVTFSVICFQTPVFLLQLFPICILQRYYSMTSRQLRRLESNSRSPVYSHFAETVSGSTCIRAYQVANEFNMECDRKNDINNTSFVLSLAAARWLAVRLEFLGNINVVLVACFAAYSRGDITPSTAGLFISYALTGTSAISSLVTCSTGLENDFVSVERCIEYTKIPTEADAEIEATKPRTSWPEGGVIEFKDYAARYRDGLDLVLKKLNFEVKAGEKVGVVGRTGAGKSSLAAALFRLVEPANGTIIIDGVDISGIGLHSLRSVITIIPQDPVLFTGSLRLNLDPLGTHSDSELWIALKMAHLKHFITSLGEGLEYVITEGGDNLSIGQRQLVCLARALLRKSRILIIDEATAAVDLETDDLIQETIETEFANCTVITIAHRLNTILDYDRVLVMDQGMVSEFDTPKCLLDDEGSGFYAMAKDAGLSSSDLKREKFVRNKL